LQKLVKTSVVQSVHVFQEGKDIPDKVDLRLVVLDPDHGHKRKDPESKAVKAAEDILSRHGEKPREFQNRVLFLVPDGNATQSLRDHVRRYLAWKSIVDDANELNLDKHHEKEANKNLAEAAARVEASIREAYRFLLAPMQDPETAGGLTKILWEDEALPLTGSTFDKAITATTREKEWVISAWAPTHLDSLLKRWFWKDDRASIGALKVWLDTCRYLYLPRLASSDVFLDTVRSGVQHKDWFAYASAEKPPGQFEGVVFGSSGGVYLDEASVLVRATAIVKKADVPTQQTTAAYPLSGDEQAHVKAPSLKAAEGGLAPGSTHRRFHGSIDIDATDAIGSFTDVVQNVIEHLAAIYGTEVSISVDIQARRTAGFDAKTVRVVKENSATMKFRIADFEEQ